MDCRQATRETHSDTYLRRSWTTISGESGVDSHEVGEGRRSEDVTHGEQGGNHVYTQGFTNRNVPEKRRARSPRHVQERSDNLERTSGIHHTSNRGRRDSGPSSSPSSSRSRSRSGGRRRNNGAADNGREKKPTERPDKSSRDGKNWKSDNGAGDGVVHLRNQQKENPPVIRAPTRMTKFTQPPKLRMRPVPRNLITLSTLVSSLMMEQTASKRG